MPVQIEKTYYSLCDMADKAFEDAGDPCNKQKGFVCHDCCDGCKYLDKDGCITKCLGCKLYICFALQKSQPHLRAVLNGIGIVAKRHDLIHMRTSGKDVLSKIRKD